MTQHPDLTFTVDVGFTTRRPVVPDERTHRVVIAAQDDIDARLAAHAMVAGHKGVVMVTRLTIVDCIA